MFTGIPKEIQAFALSAGPLLAAIVLFIAVGNFGISKISDVRSQLAKAQADKNIYSQKANLLQSLGSTVLTSSETAAVALPDSNTALAVLSQLKSLGASNGVAISNIKTSAAFKDLSGLSRVDVTFDALGTNPQIIGYLSSVSTIAPISVVDKVKINTSGGVTTANVTVKSFWAALPATLPQLNQTLTGLTPEEQDTLNTVNTLVPPIFSQLQPTSAGRADPFTP